MPPIPEGQCNEPYVLNSATKGKKKTLKDFKKSFITHSLNNGRVFYWKTKKKSQTKKFTKKF